MRRLKISRAAQRDLKAIARYIADQSGGDIARGVIDGVRKHCDRIAALPGSLGSARPELGADLRSTPHHRYIIYFRYTEDALEVINVRDARRDTFAHFAEHDPEI
ncbi:type II toxin-antitoxin system RelE/ParE family toxin [Sphingomonas glacialis]|uniref:Type II toxin-antitoxin system RelE/ParE family toxin n=1 Tax=Sphingomonas glacialis TaxID=658225 RepID=A0A502G2W8_9SPHN|nr:type II toxin-antitoxin system RelE/ParE family toxin [Sphingomonas glacialis]TPG56287.1 type II toxin-antitoxin system RelE/ParE family toxin [Sphingomonas glacialis]